MRKVALVFVLAVIVPSLVLAWLAVRSLRDQQFLLERQQSLLDQRVTDAIAKNISDYLAQQQQEFSALAESIAGTNARLAAVQFDNQLRQRWPLADVGFSVTLFGPATCVLTCPSPAGGPEAQTFLRDNSGFLGNREAAEVYWNVTTANANGGNGSANSGFNFSRGGNQSSLAFNSASANSAVQAPSQQKQQLKFADQSDFPAAAAPTQKEFGSSDSFVPTQEQRQQVAAAKELSPQGMVASAAPPASVALDESAKKDVGQQAQSQSSFNYKSPQSRKVSPQSQAYQIVDKTKIESTADDLQNNLSKVVPAEAEFRQLIGNQTDGMLARFLQNKLKLMFWHRLNAQPDLIFGAQLNLDRVVASLRDFVKPDPTLQNEICLALLDDNAKPVAVSRANFSAMWRHPFVSTEIGDALPHWEVAAYLVNPEALTRAACNANIVLGLLIGMLVLAIVIGSWLIVRSLNAELKLARQKTDFVSNVSHELKTPLTSIRMFSELLAENRVSDAAKQKSYLQIITAEAARLTRLINNVLDFSRMERGEKKYDFKPCDLTDIVRATAETFRPHLEAGGFKFDCELPDPRISVRGDADALSQIIVNLLSNAEKYSNGEKEISLQLSQKQSPLPHAEIRILDRGSGVPRGSEEKIFEKFYRAHDSLSSGIQGSGLGLTIARQIARAHGGDVVYEPREGGGSCFVLRIPISGGEK
jgi:signal transduction histidine kinase